MLKYDNQRVFFDKIVKMYNEYIKLYRFFNGGSIAGCTPFADFYWVHAYLYRHSTMGAKLRS